LASGLVAISASALVPTNAMAMTATGDAVGFQISNPS
jgi:hypothetical protein